MDDSLSRREAARPRRVSAAAAAAADAAAAAAAAATAAAELGANVSLQDGEVIDAIEAQPPRDAQTGPDRLSAAGGVTERRNSAPQAVHQRHMPMEPKKFHIPRKTKEKRALFTYVSTESREFEDMMTILTSSYIDTSSAGCFTYCKPRLVHSELLEKEFVEKRREMKADGRTDKELEESYCFLLADGVKMPPVCEKGLCVGQSWITVLGNPNKGVYLSRYSDLLQINTHTPGATGEIIIFKVMKGKVKSIYENMKNLLDPTPRFDSHISKNASKVTSLHSYRAFELTQQYFYEYAFDELRPRPRQVCPYAVITFQFKGKDSPLPSKPLAPIRLNSQSAEGSTEQEQFTVWTGDLVTGERVLFRVSLRSSSPPFLPHRLPEKLKIGCLMRLEQVTKLLPSGLFSYKLYNRSREVVKDGYCCSLLEVVDRCRSTTSVTKLLQELETKRVVLVTPLTERGFLFLLSSVQMATPTEREENWKRCLQALFVFQETRDVAKSTARCATSPHYAPEPLMASTTVMPRLNQFIPALHHALFKARANPPAELSAGVERQAREYLIGLNDSKVRRYPMGEYDPKLNETGKLLTPRLHWLNMEGYLRSYLYKPANYMLSVARARQAVEAHCGPEEPQEVKHRRSYGGQRETTRKEVTGNARGGQTNTKKIQQLIDLVLTCKRNAENEVKREEGGEGGLTAPGRKRRLEQETATRALKFLKASQEPGGYDKIPVEGSQVPASPDCLASVMGSVGLKGVDLREDGSELAAKLFSLLTGLKQAARGTACQSFSETQEEEQRESCPFDRLATKLGLPTNCDIDLRKQDELETAGSVSSLEGFSPSSHSGEMNHHGAAGGGGQGAGGGLGRRTGGYEEVEEVGEIPWVLIPITGLRSERYMKRDRNIPQDPRFQHLTTATSIGATTKSPRKSPTLSPEPSPPPTPFQYQFPEPSPPLYPSQCPSPDPSPPISPSQCPSPEPSPPRSPSQCPSPEPSPPPSPSQCPSPQTSPPCSPSQHISPQLSPPPSPSRHHSPEPNERNPLNKGNSGANEELLAPAASREFAGISKVRQERTQGKERKNEEPSIIESIHPSISPAPERTSPSPAPSAQGKQDAKGDIGDAKEVDAVPLAVDQETWLAEKIQNQGIEEATEGKQDEEGVVDMIHELTSEKETKGEAKELVGGSWFSPSISSSPARPHRDIDSIVDKHLGNFSSEIQVLMQEENVHYTFPQSPHSTSNTETPAPQHRLPYTSISQFSHYVSSYNSCPPVQDYVSSLQDSINSMLTEFGDSWPSHNTDISRTDADVALASRVSAFVAGIRAANTKTGEADEVSSPCGELTNTDTSASVGHTPALSRGGDGRQPDAITREFPDATNNRNPPASHVTLSVPTSASGSVHKPTDTAVFHPPPNKSPKSQWKTQQSHTLDVNRTVAHVGQTQDNINIETIHHTTDVDTGSSLAGSNSALTLAGFSSIPEPLGEPPHPSEPVSSLAPVSIPAPPATALSSLISQLQPEVYNSLVEIIKDVKKNSLQFYFHITEPGDRVYEDVKEHLLKQSNVEQSPVAFLSQENSDNRLLVVIKNKDIAGHIHKIPSLVSLKRHPSVVFVGIDTLDDIRNKSYNELFVSGGCIISDEFVLNPDFITHGRLTALLIFLEQHSSLESVWKWKVHCKTHKKLKEQARLRRDAATILDVLSAYQKRQIVEFLPYHHCDMMNHQSPDLDCLIEHQARYTQYRHTVFLTEHRFEKFPAYSSSGIIVANIEEILHNFTRLVGYHDIKDKQPIMDDLLASKGLGWQLSHGDSVSGPECSPSIFPEHIHPLSSGNQPQRLLQRPGPGLLPLPHLSDQLVPDASCRDGVPQHSDTDFEVLRMAISQLRAERQAQLQQQQQQLDSQAELSINPLKSLLPSPIFTGGGHSTPAVYQGGPTELVQVTPGRKAVVTTQDSIHSALQPELGEEERREDREGQRMGRSRRGRRRGKGESGDDIPVRAVALLGGHWGPINRGIYAPSSNQSRATLTGPSDQMDSDQRGEPAFPKAFRHGAASSFPVEGDRSRDAHLGQEPLIRGDGATPGTSAAGGTEVTGRITMVTGQEDNTNPALPRLQQIQQQPQQYLQQLNTQQQQHQQGSSHPHQQQWGTGLLQTPLLPRLPGQAFSAGPMLRPLSPLGGTRGLLGPTPVWPGALSPASAAALVWGFQPAGTGPTLLGVYHNPAGQGSNRYRGGQRGGFNGI